MTALLYVLLFVSLAAIIANWIAGRIRKRNDRASEQLAETDRDWRRDISPAFQTPATRHLGETTVGLDEERAA